MPSEIVSLLREHHLLFTLVLGGILIGAAIEQIRTAMRRRAWKERNWSRDGGGTTTRIQDFRGKYRTEPAPLKRPDAADQLRIVMKADFAIQPLLNRSEARVFRELDRIVLACNPAWQVMAQVSLGEILRCKDSEAYGCINSKRVDLLLVDDECRPRHAVEYQGGAHHQGAAAARDAVKKEALRRAGISYHEVVAGQTTPSDLRRLVERLVDKPALIRAAPTDGERRAAGEADASSKTASFAQASAPEDRTLHP